MDLKLRELSMSSLTWLRLLAGLGVLLTAGCAGITPHPKQAIPASISSVPRVLSAAEAPKDGPCIQTTHGCLALNPDVTEGTVRQTICVSGYTKSVRPATSFTKGIKAKLLRKAGIDEARASDYELDHIVPLALGGHPRKLSNIALQPWEGEHGALRKDALETRMHALVCHGEVTLSDAQACVADDWEACAAKYMPDQKSTQ